MKSKLLTALVIVSLVLTACGSSTASETQPTLPCPEHDPAYDCLWNGQGWYFIASGTVLSSQMQWIAPSIATTEQVTQGVSVYALTASGSYTLAAILAVTVLSVTGPNMVQEMVEGPAYRVTDQEIIVARANGAVTRIQIVEKDNLPMPTPQPQANSIDCHKASSIVQKTIDFVKNNGVDDTANLRGYSWTNPGGTTEVRVWNNGYFLISSWLSQGELTEIITASGASSMDEFLNALRWAGKKDLYRASIFTKQFSTNFPGEPERWPPCP